MGFSFFTNSTSFIYKSFLENRAIRFLKLVYICKNLYFIVYDSWDITNY